MNRHALLYWIFQSRALFAVYLLVAANAAGQSTQAGLYIGNIGGFPFVVSVKAANEVGFQYYDLNSRQIVSGSGTLSANGTAAMFTSRGAIVSITRVSGGIVSGTYSNTPFTAAFEGPLGPFADRAVVWTGSVFGFSVSTDGILRFRITASGKVLIDVMFSDSTNHGGIGSITQDGVVTVQMTSGAVWSFVFSPLDGYAFGTIPNPGTLNRYIYSLYQRQRSQLVNISTRGTIGDGKILTAGFVIKDGTKWVLVRAIGPTLQNFAVPTAHSDPTLTVFLGSNQIANNDDWATTSNFAFIPAVSQQVGAFAIPSGSRDAVLLLSLEPGAYTAQVAGKGTGSGDALIEVYQVD